MKIDYYHLFNRIRYPILLFYLIIVFFNEKVNAQSLCMPTVPSYTVNLNGQPEGIWASPNISRNDQCCAASSSDNCVFFNLTLDPRAAGKIGRAHV